MIFILLRAKIILKRENMIDIVVALAEVAVGATIGYFIAKKINNANFDIFLEQAKAKAKAIEAPEEGKESLPRNGGRWRSWIPSRLVCHIRL